MAGDIVQGPEVGHWVAAQTNGDYAESTSQAIGLIRDGKIVAGVIYENWNKQSIVCHLAIKGIVSKQFMKAACNYAFKQCGVHKIIGPVNSDNQKCIDAVAKIGFIEEARIKDAAPNADIILFSLTADRCRYLGV
jgi:RimJ/RimL family protein N-acetyltransferase